MSKEIEESSKGKSEIVDEPEMIAEPETIDNEQAGEAENNRAEESAEEKDEKKSRSKLPFLIIGAVILIGAIGGLIYWLNARHYESTDDAFIDGDIVQISPKVSAYITKIYVDSNQFVHKGDLLVELNTKDYEAKLEQAQAQLQAAKAQKNQSQTQVALTKATTNASQTQATSGVEAARNNVEQQRAAADAKKSQINQAQSVVKTAQANLAQTRAQAPQIEANLNLAQKEYNRISNLYNTGDVSKHLLDEATNATGNGAGAA